MANDIMNTRIRRCIIACAVLAATPPAVFAQDDATGVSFVDDFKQLNRSFWYVSDGWNNGPHQNCTWSKDQASIDDGTLKLGYVAGKTGERDYACGEVQSRARYGYGTFEVRMKAATGSGLNSAFFTYIGPVDKKPHDEIDFEVLGKDPSKVQLNQYISGKGGNEQLASVPGGANEAFNDYAFIWEANRLRYFVNGQLVHEVTDKAKIPSNAQKIFLSVWGSDNLKGWMGPFSYVGPTSMSIDRIAFTALGEPCQFEGSVHCSLD